MSIAAVELAGARTRAREEPISIASRRLLFITFHFPPCVEVGAYSCAQMARYLPAHGWEPTVLTASEGSYEFSDARVEPTARVVRVPPIPNPLVAYRSLRSRLPRRANVAAPVGDGAPAANGGRRGLTATALALLDTPDMFLGWLGPAVVSGLWVCRRLGVQQILSSGPCWTNHLVGLVLARRTRLPWTAHFRDPWVRDGDDRPASAHRIGAAMERAVVTRAGSVVCVTARHADLLRRRYPGLPAEKFATVPNGYDEAEWQTVGSEPDDRAPAAAARFVVTHAGTLYQGRNPEPVFRALRLLVDRGAVDPVRLQVDLIGWWDPGQRDRVEAMAARWDLAPNVVLHGPMSKTDTLRRLVRSSLLLLLAEEWILQVPAKAYEYLRAGRPILALTPADGAPADLFRTTGGAWVVDPEEHTAIAAAIGEAYRAWIAGEPARTPDGGAVRRFDRARLVGDLASALHMARLRSSGGR